MPGKGPLGLGVTLVSMQTDDRLRTLEPLRDRLAEEIDMCDSRRDLFGLTLRLVDILEQIDNLDDGRKLGRADEIAPRRAARRRARGQPAADLP